MLQGMLLRTRLVTTSVFGDVHTRDNAANAMLLLTPQMSTIKTASYSQHDAAAAPAAYVQVQGGYKLLGNAPQHTLVGGLARMHHTAC